MHDRSPITVQKIYQM